MGALKKLAAVLGFAALSLGVTAAYADDRGDRGRDRGYDDQGRYDDRRPQQCSDDHDHRSHDQRYYDYYPQDRYSRAGYYRGDRYDDRFRDRDRYDDRYGYRGSRVVRSRVFDTRYRARIYLTEEEFNSRGGWRRVCTVEARGPDRRYVPYGQLRSIASRECSRRSEIRIV